MLLHDFPVLCIFRILVGEMSKMSVFERSIQILSMFLKTKIIPFLIFFSQNVMKTGKKCYFCNQLLLSI